MRTFGKIVVGLVILFFVPAASYAIVDASIYGGYSFGGTLDLDYDSGDLSGWEYGFLAHINTGIPYVFTIGIGGFYQYSPMEYEIDDKEDATRKTYGLDGYFQIDLPFIIINPYIRGGIAIKDETEIEYEVGGTAEDMVKDKYFGSYYFGVGIGYTIFEAAILDLSIFGEYLYTTSKLEDDVELNGHAVHLGVKLAI